MVNLTSLALTRLQLGTVSTGQLLDFLESAPYLEEVKFRHATPTTGIQGGRLVSLCERVMRRVPSELSLDLHHVQPHRQSGLLYLSAPTCNQEDLTRRCSECRECRVRLECQNPLGRRTDTQVHRIAGTMDATEVRRANEADG